MSAAAAAAPGEAPLPGVQRRTLTLASLLGLGFRLEDGSGQDRRVEAQLPQQRQRVEYAQIGDELAVPNPSTSKFPLFQTSSINRFDNCRLSVAMTDLSLSLREGVCLQPSPLRAKG